MASHVARLDPPDGEFTSSANLLGDREALRRRFREDGYLYLPGLLDPEVVADVRNDVIDVCSRAGWCRPRGEEDACIALGAPRLEAQAEYFDAYDPIQKLQSFHELAHNVQLLSAVQLLFDELTYPHPLKIARLMFPKAVRFTTPEHQDYPNNQGTEEVYATWVPLVSCPVELGGLAVLEGSHRFGVLPLAFALGAGFTRAVLDERVGSLRWLSADYRPGDVVVFHSLAVHRGLPNRTADRIRLSIDFRYAPRSAPVTPHCLKPHCERLDWEQIYEGWTSKRYQYYWEGLGLTVVPWDPRYHDPVRQAGADAGHVPELGTLIPYYPSSGR
jgi:ectoine hydroxylase-related dioxygenase (phytanoyl-CoA dioxygenase family)